MQAHGTHGTARAGRAYALGEVGEAESTLSGHLQLVAAIGATLGQSIKQQSRGAVGIDLSDERHVAARVAACPHAPSHKGHTRIFGTHGTTDARAARAAERTSSVVDMVAVGRHAGGGTSQHSGESENDKSGFHGGKAQLRHHRTTQNHNTFSKQ